jgi:hypothetical protein
LALLAGRELLIVEAGWLNTPFLHKAADRFDHRWGTTQIDVDIAIIQLVRVNMIGNITLLRPAALV